MDNLEACSNRIEGHLSRVMDVNFPRVDKIHGLAECYHPYVQYNLLKFKVQVMYNRVQANYEILVFKEDKNVRHQLSHLAKLDFAALPVILEKTLGKVLGQLA